MLQQINCKSLPAYSLSTVIILLLPFIVCDISHLYFIFAFLLHIRLSRTSDADGIDPAAPGRDTAMDDALDAAFNAS